MTATASTSARSSTETKKALRRLNGLLHGIGVGYHDSALPSVIPNAVTEHGFDASNLVAIPNGDTGRMTVSIGSGFYLTLCWYRMEVTGRFEITAYAN